MVYSLIINGMKKYTHKTICLSLVFLLINLRAVRADILPIGFFDAATSNTNGCSGWTLDPDFPSSNLSVHFYIEDASNPPYYMTIIGSTTANLPRPDVNTATGYPGNHGFTYTVAYQHRYKKIYAFAINLGGTTNPQLSNSPQVVDGFSNLRYSFYMDLVNTNRVLELDLYGKKTNTTKPLIVMVHGGGFIAGDKTNFTASAKVLADAGYMVALVNYRLMGDPDGNTNTPGNTINLCAGNLINEISWYWAIQDINAAIKFLSYNSAQYGINKNKVFLYGESAGAIAVLHLAYASQQEIYNEMGGYNYFNNNPTLGNLDQSTHPPYRVATYTIKGIATVAGALTRSSFLQSSEKTPVIMLHSPCDKLVNYNIGNSYWGNFNNAVPPVGVTTSCIRPMWGSKYIVDKFEQWQQQGITVPCHKLYTGCSTHAYGNNGVYYPDHGLNAPEVIQFRETLFLNFANTISNNLACSSSPPIGPLPGLTLNPYCSATFACTDVSSPFYYYRTAANSSTNNFTDDVGSDIKCYPNPSNEKVTISVTNVNCTYLTLTIYNSKGELIGKEHIIPDDSGNFNHHLNCTEFAPGIYLIMAQGKNYSAKTTLIKN